MGGVGRVSRLLVQDLRARDEALDQYTRLLWHCCHLGYVAPTEMLLAAGVPPDRWHEFLREEFPAPDMEEEGALPDAEAFSPPAGLKIPAADKGWKRVRIAHSLDAFHAEHAKALYDAKWAPLGQHLSASEACQ